VIAPACARRTDILSDSLTCGLARRTLQRELALLQTLPTVDTITVYPDVGDDIPGMGVPVGVSFLTTGSDPLVLPNGVTDANDGYRVIRLGIQADEIAPVAQDLLCSLAALKVPPRRLSEDLALAVLRDGLAAIARLGIDLDQADIARTWDGGHAVVDDPRVVGPEVIDLLRHTFGTFGRYGHFLEVMTVEDILNRPAWGLSEGDVLLVIHGGAMEVSDLIFWGAYTEFAEAALATEAVDEEHFLIGQFGLPIHHPLAQRFLAATAAVTNAAYAWRAIVQVRVADILARHFGRPIELTLLSDLPHNRLEAQPHGVLHAKAVQPLLPRWDTRACAYDGEGIPIIICGGMGLHSYLVTGDDQAEAASFGCSHGAGHSSLLRAGVTVSATQREVAATLPTTHPDYLPGQGLQLRLGVQNIEDVISSLRNVGAVQPKARLRPLLNLTGDTKTPLGTSAQARDLYFAGVPGSS